MSLSSSVLKPKSKIVMTLDACKKNKLNLVLKTLSLFKIVCVILYNLDKKNTHLTKNIKASFIKKIQCQNIPVLIAFDPELAMQLNADGVYFECPDTTLQNKIFTYKKNLMIGVGNLTDKHSSLEIGELEPSFVFFGTLHSKASISPEKNMKLAQWWTTFIEIPCVLKIDSSFSTVNIFSEPSLEFLAGDSAFLNETDSAKMIIKKFESDFME